MLLLALSRLLQLALVFAGIKIATTLMPPAEMARVYLITSLFSITALVFINPVGMFINRRLNTWNENGTIRGYFTLFWLYASGMGLVVYLLLAVVSSTGILPFPSAGLLAAVVAGTLMTATFNQTVIPGLNLLGHRSWFNLLTVITSLTSLLVSVWAISHLSLRAEFWQVGVICGNLIGAIWGCKLFYQKLNKLTTYVRPTRRHLKSFVAFTLPIAAVVGLSWTQNQSYRFFIESSLGLHELGLFAAGYGISVGLISAWESILTAYLYPRLYKRISNQNLTNQSDAWNEYAQVMLPSVVLVGFLVFVCAPELARAMLGPQFYSSKEYVGWGVLAELGRVGGTVYAMVAHARMNTRPLIFPALAGAALSLALIALWLPAFAAHGVGAALMVSSITLFILTFLTSNRMLVIRFPIDRLLVALIMGLGLFVLGAILRWLASDTSVASTLAYLSIVGLAFLGLQFILLKPFIKIVQAS